MINVDERYVFEAAVRIYTETEAGVEEAARLAVLLLQATALELRKLDRQTGFSEEGTKQ